MSAFEFVLISFTIIAGFGVAQVLDGLSQQIRHRRRQAPYPLQFIAAGFILLLHMQYLWGLWVVRDIEWTFPLYLLFAGPAFVLGLSAHLVGVDSGEQASTAREQYFENAPATYGVLALLPILYIFLSVAPLGTERSSDLPPLVAVTSIRILGCAVIASMAFSKSERYHWTVLGVMCLTGLGLVARIVFRLAEHAG